MTRDLQIAVQQPRAAERHSLVYNAVINKLQAVTDCAYEERIPSL